MTDERKRSLRHILEIRTESSTKSEVSPWPGLSAKLWIPVLEQDPQHLAVPGRWIAGSARFAPNSSRWWVLRRFVVRVRAPKCRRLQASGASWISGS